MTISRGMIYFENKKSMKIDENAFLAVSITLVVDIFSYEPHLSMMDCLV